MPEGKKPKKLKLIDPDMLKMPNDEIESGEGICAYRAGVSFASGAGDPGMYSTHQLVVDERHDRIDLNNLSKKVMLNFLEGVTDGAIHDAEVNRLLKETEKAGLSKKSTSGVDHERPGAFVSNPIYGKGNIIYGEPHTAFCKICLCRSDCYTPGIFNFK